MRAAIQSGVRTVDLRDIPEPVPDAETALVRVRAAGIRGSDLHQYHERAQPQPVPDGHEVAGEVIHLPAGYDGPARVGDLVALDTVCHGVARGRCPACQSGQPFHCPSRATAPRWGSAFAEVVKRKPAGLSTSRPARSRSASPPDNLANPVTEPG